MSDAKGRCYCGSVAWEISFPVKAVVKCHCAMCRSLSGADYSSYVIVPETQFTFLQGEDLVVAYKATELSHKHFCSICGTTTHNINGKHFADDVVLPLGLVENYSKILAPQFQAYTEYKAEWVNIHDDVVVFS